MSKREGYKGVAPGGWGFETMLPQWATGDLPVPPGPVGISPAQRVGTPSVIKKTKKEKKKKKRRMQVRVK